MILRLLRISVLTVTLFCCGNSFAKVTLVEPPSANIWKRAEFRIEGVPTSANNFDPEIISIDAEIVAPSGTRFHVPAFWAQDFTSRLVDGGEQASTEGEPSWRLRYVPTEAGEHIITLLLSREGKPTEQAAPLHWTVAPAALPDGHGWVRVAQDRQTFETSDHAPLRPIGENVCWASNAGTFNFIEWFDAMKNSGQNVARLWMCPWWFPLEHGSDSLTRYNQDGAWRLDRVFELAEQRGIYLILCLDFHGMFQVDNPHWGGSGNWWPKNPYHKNNGGPGVHPNDFFTDARAKQLYQKRLRYLVARYGANTHLFAWEFFNEIDNVYAPHLLKADDVAAWHAEMGRWLKLNDPYRHLVTTSLTGGSDRPEIWSLPEMDFSFYHSYGDPAPAKYLARLSDDFAQRYRKPVLVGEYGTDWRAWGGRDADPHMRAQRQALWGSALSKGGGPMITWWWEEIHKDGVYPIYRAFTEIIALAGWKQGQWQVARLSPSFADAPTTAGEVRTDGSIFSGPISLNNVPWLTLPAEAAITGALSASRASETVSNYLGGTAQGERKRVLRLDAWWNGDAHLKLHVSEIGGVANLVVRVEGRELLRQKIEPSEPLKGPSAKKEASFDISIPSGHHRVEVDNVGEQWVYFDKIEVQGIRESDFPGGWNYACETFGHRQDNRALIYVVSPWAVYPAGSLVYRPPIQTKSQIVLHDWPSGRFVIRWFDPETGKELSHEIASASGGDLKLLCPAFHIDLAAIVEPKP